MYRLSVGSIFKNESLNMKEWLDHYLKRGVDHFYLINDHSTDDFMSVVKPYLEKSQITLFDAEWPRYVGRQRDMYNHFILPRLKETEWLLICDLDEFVWTPTGPSLYAMLQQCVHLGQIQINHRIFGSNGHVVHPSSVVQSFTKRARDGDMGVNYKYFVNSRFEFSSLNVHHATFKNPDDNNPQHFLILDYCYFITNHYCCQSRFFWDTIKCTRGDGDAYLERTPTDFDHWDKNDVEDLGLVEQEKYFSISI